MSASPPTVCAFWAMGTDLPMSTDPKLPESDESNDEEAVTTPGGQVGEIEEMIEESGAEVVPDEG